MAKSLLIVDDHAEMRRLMRTLVEDLFDECFECADGVAAVAAYRAHQPDWVLLDIQMKGGDGLIATRQITQASPKAKIVIVTHFASAKMQAAARAAGAIGFVSKDNLLEVRRMLGS